MKSDKHSSFLSLLKNLILVGTGGITLVLLLATIGAWRVSDRILSSVEKLFQPLTVTSETEAATIIVERIKHINELTTAVYTMEAVIPKSADRKWGELVIASTKLLYIAHGEVKAGVDLNQLTPEDIIVTDNKLRINLPPPQILNRQIDVQRSRIYNYDRGFLNLGPEPVEIHAMAQQAALKQIVETACDRGLLTTANQRAKVAIAQLLAPIDYEQVEIKTTPPSPDQCSNNLAIKN